METVSLPADGPTFEQALAELQVVLRKLEDGETGLEEALANYETGIGLLKRCYGQLRDAEQRILLLTGVDEAGKPESQPFLHAATVEESTAGPRRRRQPRADVPF